MIKVDYDVPIRRSPAEVYDYVTDVERIPAWQHVAGVRKVTKHDPGPLQVGSRFTMERTARGNTAKIDATVTGFSHRPSMLVSRVPQTSATGSIRS